MSNKKAPKSTINNLELLSNRINNELTVQDPTRNHPKIILNPLTNKTTTLPRKKPPISKVPVQLIHKRKFNQAGD